MSFMTTMEDLTKTQIVLLTLLVSFITSIATGIITTSLLAEAPQGVTQTIDRVVERTVERVTTPSGGGTVKEVTVVKEGDAIVSVIEANTKAVVRIKSPTGADGIQRFYGLGVVVNKQGLVLGDRRDIIQNGNYTVVFSDGSELSAMIHKVSYTGSMILFRLIADDSRLRLLSTVTLSESDPKLGQTVVSIEGSERNGINVGRILSLNIATGFAQTDIDGSETAGGPLLNLSGELVGLKTSNSDLSMTQGLYTSVSSLKEFIANNS